MTGAVARLTITRGGVRSIGEMGREALRLLYVRPPRFLQDRAAPVR